MMAIRRTFLLLFCLLLAEPARSRVFVRWTEPAVPAAKALGVGDLVISWDASRASLLETARKQGYRVYAEVTPQQAPAAADASAQIELTGIILKAGDGGEGQADEVARSLLSAHPKLDLLIARPGKQPQMRGSLVIKRDGVLEVSSPTAQPWIDSNLALVRLERPFHPSQVPLLGFQWNLSGPLERRRGPGAAEYSLAVAEAGAFHADLVLEVHPNLQRALAQGLADGWAVWTQVKHYIDFYSPDREPPVAPLANIGAVTDNRGTSYEPLNLMARHNIPFRVLRSDGVNPRTLEGLDLIVVFAALDEQEVRAIAAFAAAGGVAILADLHGSYPWQSVEATRAGQHTSSYPVGKGRVIELSEPVTDPETFAQDVRRLIDKQKVLVSLWNALTTLAVPYQQPATSDVVLELVNYAGEPLQVQVRVKGSFSRIVYETPEQGCCQSLAPTHRNGFSEFVVPRLAIGGRVHLKPD
jgi:hypothetical protein